mmetsp:Transcript_65405/g.136281  ORF Transcript_65405/g.136281 Transcript_65405/m.136281 type:complete len:82 (+) Transcript_65405:1373-1618(+)
MQEAWNKRVIVWGGDVSSGVMDQLSGKAWGGENVSVAIMQLGSIPNVGGVSAAPAAAHPSLARACALAFLLVALPLLSVLR